jgi:hypothetical protein
LPLAERLFSVLKDDDRKLEFTKHGFERVATQVFLVLIDGLRTALAKWKRNPEANLRSVRGTRITQPGHQKPSGDSPEPADCVRL